MQPSPPNKAEHAAGGVADTNGHVTQSICQVGGGRAGGIMCDAIYVGNMGSNKKLTLHLVIIGGSVINAKCNVF